MYAAPPDPALDRYTVTFRYDRAGNCDRQVFTVGQRTWTTALAVAADSNRATPGDVFRPADFDHAGNTLRLPGVPVLTWDYRGALRWARYQDPVGGPAEYYAYSAGARLRKLSVGPGGVATDVRYFATLDIVRQVGDSGAVVSEYQRIKLADPDQSFGEVVRWTAGDPPPGGPATQRRYRLDNLVGSAMLELADDASVISYEEYSPFGTTVFATGPSLPEVALKAYRYTGQERDQTSGLAYHGARYYAPWLSRWISPDPAGTVDGLNLYAYAGNNPTVHLDPTGLVRIPKYLSGIKNAFGEGLAGKVHKSKVLRNRIRALGKVGWTFATRPKGSVANRTTKTIQIAAAHLANWVPFVRSLSHEAGHAGYTLPGVIPKTGLTKPQYVAQNLQRHLIDEGEATLFNAEVRAELLAGKEGDIGISGQHEAQYKAIYDNMTAGKVTRDDALKQIAQLFRSEKTSTTGQTYQEYYSKPYADHY